MLAFSPTCILLFYWLTFQLLLFIKYLAPSDFFTQNILLQVIKALCLDVIWGISQLFYFLLPGWQKNDHVIFFHLLKNIPFEKKFFRNHSLFGLLLSGIIFAIAEYYFLSLHNTKCLSWAHYCLTTIKHHCFLSL